MLLGFNAHEIFQMAIEIEENGRFFYERAKQKVDDPMVREIFTSLEQQEIEHKGKFMSLKSGLPESAGESTVFDPYDENDQYLKMMADMNVFKSGSDMEAKLETIRSASDALRTAIQFEKDSIIFFLLMKDLTEEDKGRESITQLIEEEKDHLRRLSSQLMAYARRK